MQTAQFQSLIQLITKRDFLIKTNDDELLLETEYYIYRVLPLTNRKISFKWVTPKTDDKMLRSFITAFTSKYREPNPNAYRCCYPYFSPAWKDMEPINREYAYLHHVSNMYNKKELLDQIEQNFSEQGITEGLVKYGFYSTEYGLGIFCFWSTDGVLRAIEFLKKHLSDKGIPYTNEFSDARWVYRFKIGLSKEAHSNMLKEFTI
jgi:hypothetical protein